MGERIDKIARSLPHPVRAQGPANGGDHRFTVREDHKLGTAAWLRRGQKGQGTQASHCGRHTGNLLAVCVHSAGIQDRRGARLLLVRLFSMFAALQVVWADSGDAGFLEGWVKDMFGWVLTIVKRTDAMRGKFVVLPRRWMVERTFAWLGNYRRLSKDYERLPETAEEFVKISEMHRLVRRFG